METSHLLKMDKVNRYRFITANHALTGIVGVKAHCCNAAKFSVKPGFLH